MLTILLFGDLISAGDVTLIGQTEVFADISILSGGAVGDDIKIFGNVADSSVGAHSLTLNAGLGGVQNAPLPPDVGIGSTVAFDSLQVTGGLVELVDIGTVSSFSVDTSGPDSEVSGVIAGTGSFAKDGAGTLTLSGDSTYMGPTTVNAGELRVTGSTAADSDFTVKSGATVSGTGSIGGSVTVESGGAIAAGISPGTLATGSVSLTTGSEFEVDIIGPTPGAEHDQLVVTGTVALGDATLNIDDTGLLAADVDGEDIYVIIDNDGTDSISGTFAGLPEGEIVAANFGGSPFNLRISYQGGSDNNDVVLFVEGTPLPLNGAMNPLDKSDYAMGSGTIGVPTDVDQFAFDATGYFFGPGLTQIFNQMGIVRIVVEATDGTFDPAPIVLRDSTGATIPPSDTRDNGTQQVAIFPVTNEMYVVDVAGAAGSTGDYKVWLGMPGDTNGDQTVDIADVTVVATDRAIAPAVFNPESDTNKDGAVDATDLMNTFINFFNTFVPPSTPTPPSLPGSGSLDELEGRETSFDDVPSSAEKIVNTDFDQSDERTAVAMEETQYREEVSDAEPKDQVFAELGR